jgi:HEAT repeat protein
MARIVKVRTSSALLLCGLAVSCIGRDPPSISSSDPDRLIPAIKIAVSHGDRSAIPFMVADLECDDSAVRMYAIDGLRRLTNQDLGFVYYANEEARKPAVERWKQWLAAQSQELASDATQPAK